MACHCGYSNPTEGVHSGLTSMTNPSAVLPPIGLRTFSVLVRFGKHRLKAAAKTSLYTISRRCHQLLPRCYRICKF